MWHPQNGPQVAALRWQHADPGVNERHGVLWSNGEQLLDVPPVLATAGIKLQQNQICGFHDTQLLAGEGGRSRKDVILPAITADDDINIALTLAACSDHSGQRIVSVAQPDIHSGVSLEICPKLSIEDPCIAHKQILIERRSADPMHSKRGRADQCVRNALLGKQRNDAFEEAHDRSESLEREGTRPTARARLSAASASCSVTPCAAA